MVAGKWRAIKPPLSSGDVGVVTMSTPCSRIGLYRVGFGRSSSRRYWKPSIDEDSSYFLNHCLAATNVSTAPATSMPSRWHHAILASLYACYRQNVTSDPAMRYLPYRARLGPKSAQASARRRYILKNIITVRANDLCLSRGRNLAERVTKTRTRQVRVGTR